MIAPYLTIVFALSWPFLIASVLWAKDIFWGYLLNSAGMLMVTVGTLSADRLLFGKGFADAGWSWGKPRHYWAIIALVSFIWLPPTLINLAMGNVRLPLQINPEQAEWVLLLLIFTLLPSFGEEFGWRGYLLPHLQQGMGEQGMNPRKAMLFHALIWWVWHWPALVGAAVMMVQRGDGAADLPQSLPAAVALLLAISALPTMLHGVIFAWIWHRTQSLTVATVYHTLYDGVRDALSLTIGAQMIGSSDLADLWPNVLICLFGLLLLWRGNWQTSTMQQGDNQ